MSYLEGVNLLNRIEKENDVLSISFKGEQIWPFLRIYLMQILGHTNNEKAHKVSSSKVRTIINSLFSYSPISLFKKHSIWLFNGQERRKKIGNKYVHRVSGFFAQSEISFLDIEKPTFSQKHYKRSEIEELDIVSEGYFILLSHIIERILRFSKLEIEHEEILIKILSTNNIHFDYKYYVRFLWAQKLTIDLILSMTVKPKFVFIECPYPIMGYIWSLKKNGVKIFELQHGVLNSSHYAYIFRHNSIFYPDEIWVYGEREKDFFENYNPFYAKNIKEIGLYILDRSDKEFTNDIFKNYRDDYSKVIVFSGQTAVENATHDFLKDIAKLNPDFLFIYIPRVNTDKLNFTLSNVIVEYNVNIYEYLKWCDLHVTISSTTCLEASYYKRNTIFYDYQNLATNYYGEYLKNTNGVEYINNASDFRNAVTIITSNKLFDRKTPFVSFKGFETIKRINNDLCNSCNY